MRMSWQCSSSGPGGDLSLVCYARAGMGHGNLFFLKTLFICKWIKLIIEVCPKAILNLEYKIWEL